MGNDLSSQAASEADAPAVRHNFGKEEADKILQTVSFIHQHNDDVVWFPTRAHEPARSSIVAPFPRAASATGSSSSSSSTLDRLPNELLHNVLSRLDMQSLFRFRQVDLRARQAVHALAEYRLAVTHGLNLLCVLLRTGFARDVPLYSFCKLLYYKGCDICGLEFGPFACLYPFVRCCLDCLLGAWEVNLRPVVSVRLEFELTEAEVDLLSSSFRSFPGAYTPHGMAVTERFQVVSYFQILGVVNKRPVRSPAFVRAIQAINAGCWRPPEGEKMYTFMGACALPHYDRETRAADYGVACAGCEFAWANGFAYDEDLRNAIYSRDGFLDHFGECPFAQLLWESSEKGAKQPPELAKKLHHSWDSESEADESEADEGEGDSSEGEDEEESSEDDDEEDSGGDDDDDDDDSEDGDEEMGSGNRHEVHGDDDDKEKEDKRS